MIRKTDKKKGRVIVTYGRSIISLMIAQSLGSKGIEVIGCDNVGLTVLAFSKFVASNHIYKDVKKSEDAFLKSLENIIKEHKPEDDRPYVLIPAFRDAKTIAKNKKRFEKLITVACPDFEAIDKIDPKDHFAKTLRRHGVESPKTWLPENKTELKKMISKIKYPVFIKPPDDVGGRGISKIENNDELLEAYDDLKKRYKGQQIIIQKAAEGKDYCYCGIFNHGKLVASMVYHNVEKFPAESGAGVLRKTVKSDLFDPVVEKLMKPLKWHGVAEIDFIWNENKNSTPMMIEVNPRFWASLDHSVKSGVDFPMLLFKLFTDGKMGKVKRKPRIGYKTEIPGLAFLARTEKIFSNALNFEELKESWVDIKMKLKKRDFTGAAKELREALEEDFESSNIIKNFSAIRKEAKRAEKVSYAKDDPFIGFGILFVLASLVKDGKLPPELKR